MTNKTLIAAITAVCAAGAAHAAPEFNFSGYMRAGTGINTRGGTQVCMGLPGADTKWRLGNECDYVIEPILTAKIASHAGTDWNVRLMPGIYRVWGGKEFQTITIPGSPALPDSGTDELVARFGQVYAYGTNVAALANGTVWVGRRFYNRLNLGINDQFVEFHDGEGAGVDDMDLGVGKLSVALMMSPRGGANNNRLSLPIRFANIKDMPNGELSVYVTPSVQLRSKNQTTNPPTLPDEEFNGLAVGVYQNVTDLLPGGNTLIGLRVDGYGPTRNGRVVLGQSAKFGNTTIEGITEYRIHRAANNGGNKWFTIGARADTQVAGPLRLLAEAGHDMVKPDDGSRTRNMTKLTLATALTAGDDAYSRPTVRLFVTHALWNNAARESFSEDSRLRQVFGDKLMGTSVGIQAEAWW